VVVGGSVPRPPGGTDSDLFTAGSAAADTTGAAARRKAENPGWMSVFRRNRLIWVIAAASIVSLIAGLLVGRFVVSPADAAAGSGPPDAGLITVPVEFGELSNDVTIRGEVAYADPVEVRVDTSAISGPAVVTGQVPEAGVELTSLAVALEIAGRPVIVLPGELPSYRTLRSGVSGPDVVQFKTAMRAVGLDAGDPASNVFDSTAANAVSALYAQAGYPLPEPVEGAADAVRAAQDGIRSADQSLTQAKADLASARAGASAVEIRESDNAVASARRELDAAKSSDPVDGVIVANLEDALGLAQLRRQEVGAPRDVSAERSAVDSATAQLADAQTALACAQEDVLPTLPAGEVLYLTELPRRVDAVTAVRGSVLEGAAMTVSGASLGLSGSAAEADATLLAAGDEASFELPDGAEHRAVISAVNPGTDEEPRWTVELTPDPLSPEQVAQLQGSNVRVSIAVGATEGEVLSVPLAALSAGTGGESRIEVVDGDPRDGEDAETRLVVVETGLAASGAVEVRPVDGDLAEGDLVVVGT
jgi:hypothetical protein